MPRQAWSSLAHQPVTLGKGIQMRNKCLLLALAMIALALVLGCAQMRFRDATAVDTISAYERFIKDYPRSDLAERARRRMEQLVRINAKFSEALSQARTVRFVMSMDDFVLTPPAANRRLRNMLRETACCTLRSAGYEVVEEETAPFDVSFELSVLGVTEYEVGDRFPSVMWQLSGRLRMSLPEDAEPREWGLDARPIHIYPSYASLDRPFRLAWGGAGYHPPVGCAIVRMLGKLGLEDRLLRIAPEEALPMLSERRLIAQSGPVKVYTWRADDPGCPASIQRCALEALELLNEEH